MNNQDSNGQSAAKLLKVNNGEGSTTIPRKGSTTQVELEKEGIKFRSITSKQPTEKGIYMIHCIKNNKSYIGSCNNLHARIIRHTSYLKRGKHHSQKLQRAYDKYGPEKFIVGMILNSDDNLKKLEEEQIKIFNSFHDGFNSTDICITYSPFTLTKEQVEKRIQHSKIPVVCLNLDGSFAKKYSSVADASRDIKDQSTNISACCKNKLRYVKDFIFVYEKEYDPCKDYSLKERSYVFTDEHKKKIGLKNKGKIKTVSQIKSLVERSSKKVNKYSLNGDVIKKYNSLKECCLDNKLYVKTLLTNIKNNNPLGGFLYKFNENIV